MQRFRNIGNVHGLYDEPWHHMFDLSNLSGIGADMVMGSGQAGISEQLRAGNCFVPGMFQGEGMEFRGDAEGDGGRDDQEENTRTGQEGSGFYYG